MKKQYIITRDKFLSLDEVRHLLTTCEQMAELDLLLGRRVWVTRSMVVSTLFRTGLRRSEVANLKIGDLHLNGKENYLVVTKGKGNRRRDCYFNGKLAEQLKSYIAVKQRWGHSVQITDYLFSPDGKRKYCSVALFHSFKEAVRKAGLPVSGWAGQPGSKLAPWRGGKKVEGAHPHTARHSFATILLSDTGDIRAVQRQLGHQNISMTVLYADVLPARRQEVADKLSI
jgi:integrase